MIQYERLLFKSLLKDVFYCCFKKKNYLQDLLLKYCQTVLTLSVIAF